jgi:hypothetical protein
MDSHKYPRSDYFTLSAGKGEKAMPGQDAFLNNGKTVAPDVRHMADSVEKLSMITAEVARVVGKEMAEKEPPNVVVFISGGRIQTIVADRRVEAYVVECEMPEENEGEEKTAEICGLPVVVSRRENTLAPRIVKDVIRAHRREGA